MLKRGLIAIVAVVAVVAVWRRGGHEQDGGKLAFDRVWIDHVPSSDTDMIEVFAVLTEHPVGGFQTTSAWRGRFEAFRYQERGDTLAAIFPQSGDREALRVSARRCEEKEMDYCLEVRGSSRGVRRYYSRKGWEIDHAQGAADLAARADAIVHALAN